MSTLPSARPFVSPSQPDPERERVYAALEAHLRAFWPDPSADLLIWPEGPVVSELPDFRVLRVAPPAPGWPWVYASLGAWEGDEERLEFVLQAPEADDRHVRTLAMIATYHRRVGLGEGHTVPHGDEGWLPGSTCDHWLVSLPYPYGPEFEVCATPAGEVRFLWLLPITAFERRFKRARGLEALETRFDAHRIHPYDPTRPSTVSEAEAVEAETLRCVRCGAAFPDLFMVPDEAWARVVPEAWRSEVLCEPCFDDLEEADLANRGGGESARKRLLDGVTPFEALPWLPGGRRPFALDAHAARFRAGEAEPVAWEALGERDRRELMRRARRAMEALSPLLDEPTEAQGEAGGEVFAEHGVRPPEATND